MAVRSLVVPLAVLFAVFCAVATASFAPTADESVVTFVGEKVLRFTNLNDEARARLSAAVHRLTLDMWAEHPEWVDIRVPANLLPHVESLELPHYVMIEDLENLVRLERAHILVRLPSTLTGGVTTGVNSTHSCIAGGQRLLLLQLVPHAG